VQQTANGLSFINKVTILRMNFAARENTFLRRSITLVFRIRFM